MSAIQSLKEMYHGFLSTLQNVGMHAYNPTNDFQIYHIFLIPP